MRFGKLFIEVQCLNYLYTKTLTGKTYVKTYIERDVRKLTQVADDILPLKDNVRIIPLWCI